jgi:hypothetical protein
MRVGPGPSTDRTSLGEPGPFCYVVTWGTTRSQSCVATIEAEFDVVEERC